MTASAARRLIATALVSVGLLSSVASAQAAAPVLNLDTLTGAQAEQMLVSGQLTSVQLVRAYLARIAALNKAGPGLNAVTQINPNALTEAAQADLERSQGIDLGPAMGLPILLKDIVDATPMYTSAGDWALRGSYAPDSGVAAELRAHGVVILGKTGLSEWANSFGSQPSGFSNLTGQVLSAIDTSEGPSGSSSGSGAAASASLASLTIGTETSGSIISPSTMQADVGLRPTVGLVPGYGIAPIDVSQDTAGPIVRTVSDAAMTLQSIAEVPGSDALANQEYADLLGPNYLTNGDIPAPTSNVVPNYMSALTLSFVQGKRVGYNGACTGYPTCTGTISSSQQATDTALNALAAGGAILVPDAGVNNATLASLPSNYEAHATIDEYYKGINPLSFTPTNLVNEVAYDNTDPQEAEKDGISAHSGESLSDDSTITSPLTPTPTGLANALQFQSYMPLRKAAYHSAIDAEMNCPNAGVTTNTTATVNGVSGVPNGTTTCPAGSINPVIAIIGSTGTSSPAAGYPEMVVPMGYTTTQRRNIGVDISGGAYDERNIIGVGYVIEQATQLRQSAAMVDPASYRCARTVPPEPFASRGHCNPDSQSVMSMLGGVQTILPFPLETTSAQQLESMMAAHTLTSVQLVKAELTRIALSNANGPAIQAIRNINPQALSDAAASDAQRATAGPRSALEGIPVLVDDSMDVIGLPTSDGSIAMEDIMPGADSTLVARLKAAGAIILGDTNTTELDGTFDPNMPQGYSSLGGQVLLPSDTNKSIGGSSAGSAAATSEGLAPLAVGLETSTDSAQMIAPAGNAGVVALKPTVGLVSRAGVVPAAPSQDSPGPIGQTVWDVASELNVLAGPDPSDPATQGLPAPPNYTAGLYGGANALTGLKFAVINNTTAPYPTVLSQLAALGGTTTVVTPGNATTAPSIVPYEFHKGLDSYLSASQGSGPKSLQDVINYDNANPVEGLKFGDNGLLADVAVNYNDPPTTATYQANLAQGKADSQAVLNTILNSGYDAIVVPQGNALVNIADRAGYPILTVPAGYGAQNSSTGADPIGVDFIGAPFSESHLLYDGYAYEQASKVRAAGPPYFVGVNQFPGVTGAPSETNQSMWRCVPGSAFFHPYECNAGDLQAPSSLNSYPVDTGVGATVTPTLGITIGSVGASFGAFVAGVANTYNSSTAISVTSTAGSATLTAVDTDTAHPGDLVNGTFALSTPLQVAATNSANPLPTFQALSGTPVTILSYSGPVSNDPVTVDFQQAISATQPLRSGTYSKIVLLTLSTGTP